MSIKDTALAMFEACEGGQGWEACKPYCTDDAAFSCQSAALAEVTTLADYAGWMQGNFVVMPDARYEMKALGVDEDRGTVSASAVFSGTHTGEGGPVPPTGKGTSSDYSFLIEFSGDKVSKVTKIWNDGFALGELGWA